MRDLNMRASRIAPSRAAEGGFTMLELAAVVSIIGILVLIAIGTWGSSLRLVEASACYSNQRTMNTAMEMYHAEYEEKATSLSDLAEFVENFDRVVTCPSDRTVMLELDAGMVSCPAHPPRVN